MVFSLYVTDKKQGYAGCGVNIPLYFDYYFPNIIFSLPNIRVSSHMPRAT